MKRLTNHTELRRQRGLVKAVVINPHRQDEKKLMSALGLKNRKQLRKHRKKETKLKAAAVFN